MTKVMQRFTTILLLMAVSSAALFAQGTAAAEKIPVKVQVILSRYNGDRKVSSLPYMMLVTANGDRVDIQNNLNVPMSSGASTTYTNVGLSMYCSVTTEAGRFKISLQLDDKSVVDAKPATAGTTPKPLDYPSFSNFSFKGVFAIKEGETKQVTTVADKVTGEVVKIDVTLSLDK